MKLSELVIGSGPTHVVFLHGLFGQGKNFGSIATQVADIATCHLVDLPNHGRSPWTEDHTYPALAAKLAMRAALRRPELLDRLMVVDISPARNVSAAQFVNLVAALRQLDLDEIRSRTQADRDLAELIPDDTVRRFLLQNLRHQGQHWSWLPNLALRHSSGVRRVSSITASSPNGSPNTV